MKEISKVFLLYDLSDYAKYHKLKVKTKTEMLKNRKEMVEIEKN